jgi:hypothetical protein
MGKNKLKKVQKRKGSEQTFHFSKCRLPLKEERKKKNTLGVIPSKLL